MPAAAAAIGAWIASNIVLVFATVVSTVISYSNMKSASKGPVDQGRPGQLVNTCDNKIPLPLIYGRQKVGINRVYACVTGADNKYLHLIGNVCEGPIKGIYEVGGVPQLFLGDKLYTEYGNKFYYEFFTGESDQTVCATLATATSGEDDPWNEPKHYTAYIYCRFEYDPEVFQGLPEITMVVEGMNIYNPDTEVTEYSRNPALVALDFMTRSSKRGGMQIASARIDSDLIKDAATYCDTKGWTCDICLMDEKSAVDHFQGIIDTFRGNLIYSDSIFQLKYKDLNYESTVMNLTEDDVVEAGTSSLRIEQPSIFNTPNAVRCRYINPDKDYTFDDFTLPDSDAIDLDGDYREQSYEFPGILGSTNVGKMAAYLLERARLNKNASLVMGTRGMALEPHDLVTLTHSRPGWNQKVFRVIKPSVSNDGNVSLALEEEYASFYDDDYSITEEMFYDTSLPDPRAAIPSVINVSHAEETYNYRGRTFTRWRIDFERPALESYPFWDYAEVWVKVGSGDWAFATKSTGDYVLDPVEEGTDYYVRMVGVSIYGAKQAFEDGYTVSTTIQGHTDLPDDVAWMTAVAHGDSISIYAPPLSDSDIFGYEVRMGSAWDGSVQVGFNETPNFRLTGVSPGIKTFWMKALGNNEEYSANPVSAQVTVFYPPNYVDKNTWSWDFSTGDFTNTEQHVYSDVDSLRCAHSSDVLTGTWLSPEYDLGSIKDVRIWGNFITALDSSSGLWSSLFTATDNWEDRISTGQKWYQILTPLTTGALTAKLYYGDTSGNLDGEITGLEMFAPEVSARYVQVEVEITDPALDAYFYLNELNMIAAFWRDTV